jgi:hypothetical protein
MKDNRLRLFSDGPILAQAWQRVVMGSLLSRSITTLAAALALSACGSGSDQKIIAEACVGAGARNDICKCAAKKLKANLTDADYDAYVVIAEKIVAKRKTGGNEIDVMFEVTAALDGDFDKLAQMRRVGQASEAAMVSCQR